MPSMLRRTVFSLLLVLPFLAPAPPAGAAAPADAGAFIGQLANQALQILARKNLGEADREAAFDKLLTVNFDIPRIARFVLGRYWTSASDADKRKFIDTYREFVIRSYAARFSTYGGETVKVTRARAESPDVSIVDSDIIHPNGEPPIKLSWRVHKDANRYQVVDVDVEGVSMMVTQKEEFASVIQRNGGTVAGLIQAIQQKLQSGDLTLGGG